jgi:hypothetical protein
LTLLSCDDGGDGDDVLQSDLVFPDDGDQFTALKDASRRLNIPSVSCDDRTTKGNEPPSS